MPSSSALRDYYYLTKPGIIYGNLLTAAAGFLLACKWRVDLELLVATLAGIALVIGSACVFNNYIDRGIDKKMARTRQRALARGKIGGPSALGYAALLGGGGITVLALRTNLITVVLGLIGFIDYVVLYGISKRRFTQGTLVGSISGAVPPAAGYTAVAGHFDTTALLLFLILIFWQMPHFYAIALYRYDDYKKAGLPVLPVAKNTEVAKQRIMVYIASLTIVIILLKLFGGVGYSYLVIALALNLAWLYKGIRSFNMPDDQMWGKQMFLFSLIVICGLSGAIALGTLLP